MRPNLVLCGFWRVLEAGVPLLLPLRTLDAAPSSEPALLKDLLERRSGGGAGVDIDSFGDDNFVLGGQTRRSSRGGVLEHNYCYYGFAVRLCLADESTKSFIQMNSLLSGSGEYFVLGGGGQTNNRRHFVCVLYTVRA